MESLQFILVAGVVVVMLVNIALLAAAPMYFERKIRQHQITTSKKYDVHLEAEKVLAEIDIEAVKKQAHKDLLEVTKTVSERFHANLDKTVDQVVSNINDITSTQLSQEFEKYQVSLQALREQSITEFTKLQKELDIRKQTVFAELDKLVAAEHAKRAEEFAGRLGDVVSAYLVEALGNQVDLGAQTSYIFAALEQHKDQIKKDILA